MTEQEELELAQAEADAAQAKAKASQKKELSANTLPDERKSFDSWLQSKIGVPVSTGEPSVAQSSSTPDQQAINAALANTARMREAATYEPNGLMSALQGATQGWSYGLGDEMLGAAAAQTPDTDSRAIDRYRTERDAQRLMNKTAQESNPIRYALGNIAGALLSPNPIGKYGALKAGGSMLSAAGRNALVGAGLAGAYGAGASDTDLTQFSGEQLGELGKDVLGNALFGGALGAGLGAGGQVLKDAIARRAATLALGNKDAGMTKQLLGRLYQLAQGKEPTNAQEYLESQILPEDAVQELSQYSIPSKSPVDVATDQGLLEKLGQSLIDQGVVKPLQGATQAAKRVLMPGVFMKALEDAMGPEAAKKALDNIARMNELPGKAAELSGLRQSADKLLPIGNELDSLIASGETLNKLSGEEQALEGSAKDLIDRWLNVNELGQKVTPKLEELAGRDKLARAGMEVGTELSQQEMLSRAIAEGDPIAQELLKGSGAANEITPQLSEVPKEVRGQVGRLLDLVHGPNKDTLGATSKADAEDLLSAVQSANEDITGQHADLANKTMENTQEIQDFLGGQSKEDFVTALRNRITTAGKQNQELESLTNQMDKVNEPIEYAPNRLYGVPDKYKNDPAAQLLTQVTKGGEKADRAAENQKILGDVVSGGLSGLGFGGPMGFLAGHGLTGGLVSGVASGALAGTGKALNKLKDTPKFQNTGISAINKGLAPVIQGIEQEAGPFVDSLKVLRERLMNRELPKDPEQQKQADKEKQASARAAFVDGNS